MLYGGVVMRFGVLLLVTASVIQATWRTTCRRSFGEADPSSAGGGPEELGGDLRAESRSLLVQQLQLLFV